ncbi:MAG: peptidylprolyl isomerase [Pirellulales bacterium]
MNRRLLIFAAAFQFVLASVAVSAAEIAATVGAAPIYVEEVEAELARTLQSPEAAAEAGPALKAAMLRQLVDQQLVLAYLVQSKQAVSDQIVERAVDDLKQRLAAKKIPFEEYLADLGMPEDALRRHLKWRYSWRLYVQRRVDDAALQKYFETNRHDFDGREVRYAQILLRPAGANDQAAVSETVAEAKRLAARITAGELSFAEAAKQFSQSPTAQQGGDQGFISRRGETIEAIAAAVFALDPPAVSEPIVTPFGVHLLQATEVKPGGNQLDDVREQVQRELIQVGFGKLVEYQKSRVPVKYTGAMPYLDADGKLVE